ncbi:MAG: Fe-S cluster assembly scaffold protein NifU [Deltaproteobacteria bacterium]|nr:Fe-S cluster assembly scaffold protein NifU [Deltaproteobacteria bacterium]
MKSTQYSEKVLDHFRNPRNVGTLEGDNVGWGEVGNPVCGDLMKMYIQVEDDKIADIKFQTFGCGSAIATSSMITEMAKGKTLDEALKITRQDVADELEGLPPIKMHCSNLAADALHEAINNYKTQKGETTLKVIRTTTGEEKEISGEKEFLGKGVYHAADDLSPFADKRVMVVDRGKRSLEIALELTKHTGRVVVMTPGKTFSSVDAGLAQNIKQSDIKIIYESELLEIRGSDELEKVLVHDLNEDEEYELFVDAVIILK